MLQIIEKNPFYWYLWKYEGLKYCMLQNTEIQSFLSVLIDGYFCSDYLSLKAFLTIF